MNARLILTRDLQSSVEVHPDVFKHFEFGKNFRGETVQNTPLFVQFAQPAQFEFLPEILSSWHEACIAECGHQRKSNFRKHHEPAVYRVVMDAENRSRILDRAFDGD